MMKKMLFFLVLFLLLALSAYSQEDKSSLLDFDLTLVQGQELPGPAKTLFGDERINVYLTLNNGSEIVLGIITEEGKLQEVSESALTNPTLIVKSSEQTITEIQSSDKPIVAFQKALEDKKITYSAVGGFNKVKYGIIAFFMKIASWFGYGK